MTFVYIKPGVFMAGSPLSAEEAAKRYGGSPAQYKNEKQYEVTIKKGFYLQNTEVTVKQFKTFVDATGHKTDIEKRDDALEIERGKPLDFERHSWRNPGFKQEDNHPVVCVSWNDAVALCQWLTKIDKKGRKYRLPAEAEWEYACRAGEKGEFQWGDNPDDGKGWCNGSDSSEKREHPSYMGFNWDDGYVYTAPVASFRPNKWRLYDMSGNVSELCREWLGKYIARNETIPMNSLPVLHGGSYHMSYKSCRCGGGTNILPNHANGIIGFRVLCEIDK